MTSEETVDILQRHNIDMAKALNEKKMFVNTLANDVLNLRKELIDMHTVRAELEEELVKKDHTIEKLQTALNESNQKLITWRTLVANTFKDNVNNYAKLLQVTGIASSLQTTTQSVPLAPSPTQNDAVLKSVGNETNSRASSETVQNKSCGSSNLSGNITFRSSRNKTINADEDLIRFSKTPVHPMAKANHLAPTENEAADTASSECLKNLSSLEQDLADSIVQLNETLELSVNCDVSVLHPQAEVNKSNHTNDNDGDENGDGLLEDELLQSIVSMKITGGGDKPNADPVKRMDVEWTTTNKTHNASIPSIHLTPSEKVDKAAKRKSDEDYLRVPRANSRGKTIHKC